MKQIKFDDLEFLTGYLEKVDTVDSTDIPEILLKDLGITSHSAGSIKNLLDLIDKYDEALKASGPSKWFIPGTPFSIENCPKHKLFFEAGATYNERCFMASNRSGKSVSGSYELACHLTGEYPVWWKGRRFNTPVNTWAAGSTARSTRDTVQKELIGPVGAWGTGMIPAEKLGQYWSLAGVPQGLDMIKVKHVSGGWSTVGFKNYEQDVKAFYGTAIDVAWLDEEVPSLIYNEVLLRTMTTNGLVYVTFTPLAGLTPFVVRFCRQADFLGGAKRMLALEVEETEAEKKRKEDGEDIRFADLHTAKALIQAGWDDVPWLTEASKKQMLDDTPPHLQDARSKGIPAMGSGNVYPIPLEDILVTPFEIPHHFKKLYAMDVGWNRTSALWIAEDPNTGTIYLYDEHYMGEAPPAIHAQAIKNRGEWIYGVIDPASRGRSQIDGQSLITVYKQMGLKLFPANNEVEGGINNVWNMLSVGKIKVFKTLINFQKEYMLYRRDEKGKIIKHDDHLMDAWRYAINNIKRARSTGSALGTGGSYGPTTRRYDI
jgi:phage terminase large subunit-like protein